MLFGLVQGLLSTLSLAPYNLPFLVWLAPWPLFYFAERFRGRPRMLFASGAVSSLWLCTFSFYWMLHLFQEFGGLPLILSLLIFVPYTVLLNLKSPLFVLLFGLTRRSSMRSLVGPGFLAAGALGTLTDFLTPQIFPWYWGNLLAGNPWLAQWAEVGGVYLLTLVLFSGSYVLYRLTRSLPLLYRRAFRFTRGRALRVLPVPAALVLLLLLGGARKWQMEELQADLPRVRVATVQPNAPLERAGQAEVTVSVIQKLIFRTIPDLAERAVRHGDGRVDLIVLPESAVPYYSADDTPTNRASRMYAPPFERMVRLLALNWNAEVFFNEVTVRPGRNALGEYAGLAYNSSALYTREGRRKAVYDKQMLLAFGEYIPGVAFLKATGLIYLVPGVVRGARFYPGALPRLIPYSRANQTERQAYPVPITPEAAAAIVPGQLDRSFGPRTFREDGAFAPLICYEVLSPELIRTFFTANKRNPDFFVNITQDGWYGTTIETFQHYELGRLRSLETRRALVRSTNSGSSGFVDIAGNYVSPLYGPVFTKQEQAEVQVWDVPVHRSPPTLYVRFGNWWIWLLVLVAATTVLHRHRHRHKRVADSTRDKQVRTG